MVLKEFIGASYHLVQFFNQYNYPARFQALTSSLQSAAANMMNDDWHIPVYNFIDELQGVLIEYEQQSGFPFDNNPLLLELGLNDYVSVSGLEAIRGLTKVNLDETRQLCNEGFGKIQASLTMLRNLNEEFGKINLSKDAREFYSRDERTLLRVTFPVVEHETLDVDQDDFKRLTNALKGIGRLDKNANVYAYDIVSVSQSSPLGVLLLVTAKYGVVLNIFLKTFNKRWREIEDTREVRAKIRHLNAETDILKAKKDQMLKDLEMFDDNSNSGDDAVVDEIMSTLKEEGVELDGATPEVREALKKSLKFFDKNMQNGGSIGVYPRLTSGNRDIEKTKNEIISTRMPQSRLEAARKLIQG
jgi:hypothetical protein